MKKILILGCNSFSGSSFIDIIPRNQFKIYGISRSNVRNNFNRFYNNSKKINFAKIDISKNLNQVLSYIKKIKPNFIVNFISESMVAQSWKYP